MMTAIDLLKRLLYMAESETPPGDTLISLNVPVDIVREIISAEPEHTNKHTETHACDYISRQAAIDAVNKNRDAVFRNSVDYEGILYDISNQPPAQPELIRCKDCREFRRSVNTDITFCDRTGVEVKDDDFCSKAEVIR